MYKWVRLGPPIIPEAIVLKVARRIGFLPLLLYGVYGSTLSYPSKVHMVIGKPIVLPKLDDPNQEQLEHHLQQFIQALSQLFDTYKRTTGHADEQLQIL